MKFIVFVLCLFMSTIFSGSLLPAGEDSGYPCQKIIDLFHRHKDQVNRIWIASQKRGCSYQDIYASFDSEIKEVVREVEQEKESIYLDLCEILLARDFPSLTYLKTLSGSEANVHSIIVSLVESSQDKYLRALCVEKMLLHKREDGSIDVRPEDFAFLYDRYQIDKGEGQEYGTIHAIGLKQNNTYKPAPPVRDSKKLKERRLALGLDNYKSLIEVPRFYLVFGRQSFLVDPSTFDKSRSSYSYILEYQQLGLFIKGKSGIRPASNSNSTLSLSHIDKEEGEKLFILNEHEAIEVSDNYLHLNCAEFLQICDS